MLELLKRAKNLNLTSEPSISPSSSISSRRGTVIVNRTALTFTSVICLVTGPVLLRTNWFTGKICSTLSAKDIDSWSCQPKRVSTSISGKLREPFSFSIGTLLRKIPLKPSTIPSISPSLIRSIMVATCILLRSSFSSSGLLLPPPPLPPPPPAPRMLRRISFVSVMCKGFDYRSCTAGELAQCPAYTVESYCSPVVSSR